MTVLERLVRVELGLEDARREVAEFKQQVLDVVKRTQGENQWLVRVVVVAIIGAVFAVIKLRPPA